MKTLNLTGRMLGPIRELHGVNCAPYNRAAGNNQTLIQNMFTYAGIPRSRLHDCCGPWGGAYFVDIPNIFRDFDADENDPASYDFHYTDEYIGAIIRAGAQIVYRLGVTIEWGSKKYVSYPPRDFRKWAAICEHIVRHYNEGWNNGFHYDIEYWEIWNEPENPPMWQGTKEEFFELYRVASLQLRKCFPQIKIGGYGGCGFYAAFRPGMSDFYRSFLTWFDEFLAMVREHHCPLDFYTWHIYTKDVSEVVKSQQYVRERLDRMGFAHVESHLNEWNYGPEGGGFRDLGGMVGAAFDAAALIAMQECGIDLAQYYDVSALCRYNGFMDLRTQEFTPVIHVFAAFSRLFGNGAQVEILRDEDAPWALAAQGEKGVSILLSNYRREAQRVALAGAAGKRYRLYELTDENGFAEKAAGVAAGTLEWDFPANAVCYLTLADGEPAAELGF